MRRAEDKLTKTVRVSVAKALRQPGKVSEPLLDNAGAYAREAMEAALSAGGDALTAARGVTRGVLLGISDAGGDGLKGGGKVVTSVVDSAIAGGNEAAVAGWRALQGVVDAAAAAGTDATAAVGDAADAVAKSVVSAGESAAAFVQRLIRSTTPYESAPAKRRAKTSRRGPVRRSRARRESWRV
jgi:hypothetical protein